MREPTLVRPVECFDVPMPSVPNGTALDGLRVLHLSDLHVRKRPSWDKALRRLCAALAHVQTDLVVFTGDLMDHPGDEDAAIDAVSTIVDALPPARGLQPLGLRALAVMGNHDTVGLDRSIEAAVPGLRVLRNEAIEFTSLGLHVLGWSWPEDPLGSMLKAARTGDARSKGEASDAAAPFTLTLAHMPSMIFPAADLALPLVLTGHTHAGQIRVSPRLAPHTSSDVPVHLASGVLRLRSTLCCISRGLGDGVYPGLRFNCPWQAPLYTLRHGPLPAFPERGDGEPHSVQQVVAW